MDLTYTIIAQFHLSVKNNPNGPQTFNIDINTINALVDRINRGLDKVHQPFYPLPAQRRPTAQPPRPRTSTRTHPAAQVHQLRDTDLSDLVATKIFGTATLTRLCGVPIDDATGVPTHFHEARADNEEAIAKVSFISRALVQPRAVLRHLSCALAHMWTELPTAGHKNDDEQERVRPSIFR